MHDAALHGPSARPKDCLHAPGADMHCMKGMFAVLLSADFLS